MKRGSIIIVLFLLFVITITSCCDSELIRDVHFSQEALLINPYTGTEEIQFTNQTGDSLTLRAEFRKSEFYNFYNESSASGMESCKGDYVNLEKNITQLNTSDNQWRFKIELIFFYYFTSDSSAQNIRFESAYLPDSAYNSETDRNAFFGTDTIYDRGMYLNHYYDFHPEVTIGSKTYKDIYEFFLIQGYSLHTDWVDTLYYSIPLGIVGFKTRLGETWYMETSKE